MNLRVVVVGIPGVGKTTVVDKLVPKVKGAKLVVFGTVMLEEAKRRRWVRDRDQLRKLTVGRQKDLQKLAATRISALKDKVVFVDTHLFIRTKEGYWPGLPFDVVRAMKPTHLVLVEATPEEVERRRSADPSRARDKVSRAGLKEELDLAREFLVVASTLSGAPLLAVRNVEGKASETAEQLARTLEVAAG
jgi:adenylate kinase